MSGVTLLPRVLEKIFSAFTVTDATQTQPIAFKNLRRHASALLVKLGIKYPLLLLPVFDQINATVQNLLRQPGQLTSMEKIVLNEALLVISNHFCDYERQTKFVAETLQEFVPQWTVLPTILKTGCDFVRFYGLDKVPGENDSTMDNRKNLQCAVGAVLAVVRRCSWPDDPDRASRGGFVVGLTESGNPVCRNPVTQHVVPLLPPILTLLKVLNDVFRPEALALLSDGYKNAYSMIENEKKALMGISLNAGDPLDPTAKRPTTPLDKMQTDITVLYENCYHLMGAAGPSLGRDLYQLDGVAAALIGSVFSGLEHLPDFRIRPIIRVFLKPFVYSCPPAFYESVLLPIFAHVAPFSKFRRMSFSGRLILIFGYFFLQCYID